MNTEKLANLIKSSGITITSLAKKLQITRGSLYNKLNGETEFTVTEIIRLGEIFRLTNEEKIDVFFK